MTKEISNWKEYLLQADDKKILEEIRTSTRTGRPAGNEGFIKQIEVILGRTFEIRPTGRPPKPHINIEF